MKKITVIFVILLGVFGNNAFCQSNSEKLLDKADAEIDSDQYQQAFNDYTAAIPLIKHNKFDLSNAYCGCALALEGLKHYHAAIGYCNTALAIDKRNANVYEKFGYTYGDSGAYELSISYYTKAMSLIEKGGIDEGDTEGLAITYILRGNDYEHCRQFDKSILDYDCALRLDPKYDHTNMERANAYNDMGLFQQAVNDYNKALDFYHSDKSDLCLIYEGKGFAEFRLKDYDKAMDDENAAITLDSTDGDAMVDRAMIYRGLNNMPAVVSECKRALKFDTDKINIAYCNFFIGDTAKAIALLKHRLSASPGNSESQMDCCYTLASVFALMNKSAEALTYLKKAADDGEPAKYISTDPDFDNIRNNPGFIALVK